MTFSEALEEMKKGALLTSPSGLEEGYFLKLGGDDTIKLILMCTKYDSYVWEVEHEVLFKNDWEIVP